jgi:hypothetical protein
MEAGRTFSVVRMAGGTKNIMIELVTHTDALQLCLNTAYLAGHSEHEALTCENFSTACPKCPFVETTRDRQILNDAIKAKRQR